MLGEIWDVYQTSHSRLARVLWVKVGLELEGRAAIADAGVEAGEVVAYHSFHA